MDFELRVGHVPGLGDFGQSPVKDDHPRDIVEGYADAVAGFAKLWFSCRVDILPQRRKRLRRLGFALSKIACSIPAMTSLAARIVRTDGSIAVTGC